MRPFLKAILSTSVPLFLLLSFMVQFTTSLFFGELRLVSRSVWPPVILHCFINGVSMPLILNGFISLNGVAGVLLTPTNEGLVMAALFGLIGWWLYQYRLKHSPRISEALPQKDKGEVVLVSGK